MRKFIILFILLIGVSQGFAQDTIAQIPVPASSGVSGLTPSEISVSASQESYLTRYLRFFDKRSEAAEIIDKDEAYAPIFEGADSIFQERLKKINTLMDLPYNEHVRAYIEVYVDRKRTQTKMMLGLAKYYFPIFERELAKHDLPTELKYVAIIESALNPRAMSPAGAGGLWQFIYRTGKMYGLEVNKDLDERFDVEKATAAAALYLKSLYTYFNDWTLAIAAYNCGPGTVNKAIKRAKGKRDYWAIYNYLPRETRNYVPAFIGATYAMTYYREHGITVSETDFPEMCDTLMVDKKVYFSQIAQFTGAHLQTIRDYNPQYKSDFIPAGGEAYVLKLPINYILKFIEYGDTIFVNPVLEQDSTTEMLLAEQEEQKKTTSKIIYRIKRGDNLSLIALRFGVKIDQIKTWNDLKSDALQINQKITIYTVKNNVRDMSDVIAAKNAEKAKVAAEAAAKAEADRQLQASKQKNPKPASTQSNGSVQKTNGQKDLLAKSPTSQSSNKVSTTKSAVTTVPSKSSPQKAKPKTKPQPTPKPKALPIKSATGKMRASNIAVIQSKNTAKSATVVHYRVRKGETLFSIQRKHSGSNIQEIINMNNLRDNGNKIYPNQVLTIRIN